MVENSTSETPITPDNLPSESTTTGFTPLLTTNDWNEEWKELQKARRQADDVTHWDKRASTFGTADAPNSYVRRFLELADIQPGESVFDMGCGTGALSLPLGAAGHPVVAADFSQGMLGVMEEQLAKRGIATVTPQLMSWDDDWAAHGVLPGSVDVAVASRSIATADLKDSLLRLTDVARRRVCITLTTGWSPRTDERVLTAIGLQNQLGRDYLYAFAILVDEGFKPEVSYIESSRTDTFDTFEEAFDTFSRMVNDVMGSLVSPSDRDAALARLHTWLTDNLVENARAGEPDKKGEPEKRLALREPRKVTWAFIAWDK